MREQPIDRGQEKGEIFCVISEKNGFIQGRHQGPMRQAPHGLGRKGQIPIIIAEINKLFKQQIHPDDRKGRAQENGEDVFPDELDYSDQIFQYRLRHILKGTSLPTVG